MAWQQKHPRSHKLDGDSDDTKTVTKRITRSESRKMKTEPEANASSSHASITTNCHVVRPTTFLSTLIAHPELFFDRFVPLLATSSLVTLCEALQPHATARQLLQRSQQWRYVAERDEALGRGAWSAVTRTVNVARGCPELCDYLSMRSQRECFDANVVVTAGDLEFIREVDSVKVDCLAFPTSAAFYDPGIGVSGCVHRRAGPELNLFMTTLPSPRRRDQLTTRGYRAGVKLLIHCVGPSRDTPNRQSLLYSAYMRALVEIERAKGVDCAAFASISTGTLRYPVDEAAHTAMAAVRDLMRARAWPPSKKIAFVCVDKHVLQAFVSVRDAASRMFATARPLFPERVAGNLV